MAAAFSSAAMAQDADARIRQLEEQLKALTEELQAVKAQVKEQGERPSASTPAPAQAAAPAGSAAGGAGTATRSVGPASPSADALQERLQTLEQRVEQQGILARLSDGLVIEDPRQRWRLRLTGRALGDFRAFAPDVIAADTFSVRQGRLGVNLTFMRDWSIYVEGEYSGSATNQNVILSNAYVDWQIWSPGLRLRVGQFKPLFGLEHTDRVPYFDFTERGLPAGLIQNFLFDRGIMLFGQPTPGMYYGLSATNGTGQNIDERQANGTETRADGKDVSARLAVNLAQIAGWNDAIVQGGVSYKQGTQSNSVASPAAAASITTEGRGLTFFVPQAFNPTTGAAQVGNIDRRLIGVEALLAKGPVKLQAEYLQARYSGERLAAPLGGFDRDISGYYVSATWLITGESYADAYRDAIIARIRPRNDFSWEQGTWGAWEVGARFSSLDASDFKAGNAAFTGRPGTSSLLQRSASGAKAYTVGLKWMPNAYVRFLLDYVRTDFDEDVLVDGRAIGHEDALNFRAQFDFF